MALKNDYSNTVHREEISAKNLKTLTVLQKDDPRTIYNMIFAEKPEKNEEQKA